MISSDSDSDASDDEKNTTPTSVTPHTRDVTAATTVSANVNEDLTIPSQERQKMDAVAIHTTKLFAEEVPLSFTRARSLFFFLFLALSFFATLTHKLDESHSLKIPLSTSIIFYSLIVG